MIRNNNCTRRWRSAICRTITMTLTVVLLSCGSGVDQMADSGGIGGTGVTIGTVSGYGSIFVNDTEFFTSEADIYYEGAFVGIGDTAARSRLGIGQQVVVQGGIANDGTGTALTIDAFYRVSGPVQSVALIDSGTYEITILDQIVYADRQTAFIGISPENIVPDIVLRVSGPVDENAAVHADQIALMADNSSSGVKGTIQSLNTGQHTFRINSLSVDYSPILSESANVNNGQSVSITGEFTGSKLVAASMTLFETESYDNAAALFIDGFITAPTGQSRWRVGRYTLELTGQTAFEGLAEEELTTGLRIRARGQLVNRSIQAAKISAATRIRMDSSVAAVDADSGLLYLNGIPSIPVHVSELTRIHGAASDLSEIAIGDYVRILADTLDSETPAARAVFVSPANNGQNRFLLQGPVTSVSDPQFGIMGFQVDTDTASGVSFQDENGQELTAAAFITSLAEGTQVRLTGSLSGSQIIFEEISIVK